MRLGKRAAGWALLTGAAIAGSTIGYLAERRVMGGHDVSSDPEWLMLSEPLGGRIRSVRSDDGTELHVRVFGPDGAPTIVLSHGYAVAWRFWHYQIRALSEEFRVVAYDQRGHGRSAPAASGDYTMLALGRDLAAVIEDAATDSARVVVVGHSMGGMAVLALAQEVPAIIGREIAGAVLVNTAPKCVRLSTSLASVIAALGSFEEIIGLRKRGKRLPIATHASDVGYLLTRALGTGGSASPAQIAFLEGLIIDSPNDVRAALARTFVGMDLNDAIAKLTVPTVVVSADCDVITPATQSRELVERLPDATLVELCGAGHALPVEAHEALNAEIRALARRVLEHPGPAPAGDTVTALD